MGRASRRKRERRSASPQEKPAPGELGSQGLDGVNMGHHGVAIPDGHSWGGRRTGAGRPRLYTSDAERQAAYRARRRSTTSSIPEHRDGKPPAGGAPDTT
jgi:hypothetical protein